MRPKGQAVCVAWLVFGIAAFGGLVATVIR